MSKMEELIKEKCPNGVEYKKISDVCNIVAGGDAPKDHMSNEKTDRYSVPIYSNGIEDNALYGYTDEAKIFDKSVTISARGTIGWAALRTEPFYPIVRLICACPQNKEELSAEYLYFFIQTLSFQVPDGGIPQLTVPMIGEKEIPVPPIEVQQEIVRVLKKFTELEAGLQAELDARKKQYEYYRATLLTFAENVETIELGKIVPSKRGIRVVKNQLFTEGGYPVYQNSLTPLGYHSKANCKANTTFVICAGAAGEIGYSRIDFWAADDCYYYDCPKELNNRFLYHVLMSQKKILKDRVRKGSVPRISRDNVDSVIIPVPSIETQLEIVSKLDVWDAICNDNENGLPAEIEARHKQYEYYRDKLLTFERKVV